MNEKNNITKTAMITVCGRPNVGKSSLTNALVGEKIAIVSNKPQTTRNRIYGVVNRGDTQFILLDTPGLHKARSRLGDYMVKVVRESLASVEAALLLVEPIPHVGEPEKILLQRIREEKLPCVLCINKIDTVERKDDLLAVIAAYSEVYPDFDAIIPISARTGDGLEDLLTQMQRYAVVGADADHVPREYFPPVPEIGALSEKRFLRQPEILFRRRGSGDSRGCSDSCKQAA